ncbi:MAG: nitrate reductase cytochrome c-type subunit, partial [Bacteroidetes bacterium]|nr:nitrate reductase cytochrome c-type subunit [Bacteroidota bacterium]
MKILSRGFIILLFGCLLVGAAAVLEVTLRQTSNSALLSDNPTEHVHSLPLEQGVFKNNELALAYGLVQVDSSNAKDLKEYYANRAYHGAPPVIPHPINTLGTIGAQGCLQCHQKGGYVSKFKAFAPVT